MNYSLSPYRFLKIGFLLSILIGLPIANARIVYFNGHGDFRTDYFDNPSPTIMGPIGFSKINVHNGTFYHFGYGLGGVGYDNASGGGWGGQGEAPSFNSYLGNGASLIISGNGIEIALNDIFFAEFSSNMIIDSSFNWGANSMMAWNHYGSSYVGLRIDAGNGNYNFGWASIYADQNRTFVGSLKNSNLFSIMLLAR